MTALPPTKPLPATPAVSPMHPPSAEASGGTLPERLRRETHAEHARIEANPRFSRLMAPDLTRAEYRDLLARMFGHHQAAEAALSAWAPRLPAALELDRRLTRTPLLAADLAALGLSRAGIDALPRCAVALADEAAAWGTLYVLEGSALGGQIIARRLAETLGLGPAEGTSAMVPHGPDTGVLWRSFRGLLAQAEQDEGLDGAAVIDAARAAFSRLDTWMA